MQPLINSIGLPVVISAAIVIVGLLIGIGDVTRLSLTRALAIAGVCFRESLRRRVLLVIPLAIIGVLGVSAFQKSVDEQDAIRQMLKFSLFATGLLIVITLIILACTNLPREIENRVIYTIVTKPTTRLEIVLGKVMGFASVAFVVLFIMGLFSWGYLNFQSWRLQGAIAAKLDGSDLQPSERQSLEHYQKFGLLSAKRLENPDRVAVLAELPTASDPYYWTSFAGDGDVAIPFRVDPAKLDAIMSAAEDDPNPPKLVATVTLRSKLRVGMAPASQPFVAPLLEQNSASGGNVAVSLLNQWAEALVDPNQLASRSLPLKDGQDTTIEVPIPRAAIAGVRIQNTVYVQVSGVNSERLFGFGPKVATLEVRAPDGKVLEKFDSFVDPIDSARQSVVFRGRSGRGGAQQIRGEDSNVPGTLALMSFRKVDFTEVSETVGIEMKVTVERGNADDASDKPSEIDLTFYNKSKPDAAPIVVKGYPENSRTIFLTAPAAAVEGGNFDIVARVASPQHWISVERSHYSIVADRKPFALNLFLSLLIMWLMSLLVIVVAVCSSTFLSWPIAVVFTLMILLVRWVVVQLADSLQTGLGNQVATQLGFQDAAIATATSKSVEALAAMLRVISTVLPDISQFQSVSDIELGLLVPAATVLHAGATLLLFGLPILVLGYIFMRYKEVAP